MSNYIAPSSISDVVWFTHVGMEVHTLDLVEFVECMAESKALPKQQRGGTGRRYVSDSICSDTQCEVPGPRRDICMQTDNTSLLHALCLSTFIDDALQSHE